MKFVQQNERWADRGFLTGLTLFFVVGWISLLARLHHAWPAMQMAERDWAVSFAIAYPLPRFLLFFKRSNKYLIALLAYVAFFVALKLKFP
jgi:hypothetical protein